MLHVVCPNSNLPERRYVLDVVLDHWLGLPYEIVGHRRDGWVTISEPSTGSELCLADDVLGSDDLSDLPSMETIDGWMASGALADRGLPVPDEVAVLWHRTAPPSIVDVASGVTTIGFDLLGTVFAVVSGLAELAIGERDVHGRVPMRSTLLARRGLTGRPVVDELVALLDAALVDLWPRLPRRRWEFVVRPTHDIDRLSRYGPSWSTAPLALASELRRKGPRRAVSATRQAVAVRLGRARDPYDTFDSIMDASERAGVASSFFFISRYQPSDGTRVSRYDLADPELGAVLRSLDERGHTIGLHPGYRSFGDVAALRADVAALREATVAADVTLDAVGGRHHYLRWDPASSPGAWQQAGLVHDSTVGYAEAPGFRAGTSRPYPLWDHHRRRATAVEERPLLWMDTSVVAAPGGLSSEDVIRSALDLRSQCRRHGGSFTFLVHNDGYAAPGGAAVYRLLLEGGTG
ncbi:MAG: polysaccharide deacetylase family protein [Acidimicrobiales bacterium]